MLSPVSVVRRSTSIYFYVGRKKLTNYSGVRTAECLRSHNVVLLCAIIIISSASYL